MAELIDAQDLTDASQHGWAIAYRIRREDGEELHVEVRCWEEARAAAKRGRNTDALEAIAEQGLSSALDAAELAESPAARGAVVISIWFDPADDGNLRQRISYERAAE